jgi:hypothetical protein
MRKPDGVMLLLPSSLLLLLKTERITLIRCHALLPACFMALAIVRTAALRRCGNHPLPSAS